MKAPPVRIASVEIPVTDLARACAWYERALGFVAEWSDADHAMLSGGADGEGGPTVLLVQTKDAARLAFTCTGTGVRHGVVDVRTADLDGLHAHLAAMGARVDELAAGGNEWAPRGFGFFDCEGNRLGAFSYAQGRS